MQLLDCYKIVHTYQTNSVYQYYILEDGLKNRYFAKQLLKPNVKALNMLKNEVQKNKMLVDCSFRPKLVAFDLKNDALVIFEYIKGTSLLVDIPTSLSGILEYMIKICDIAKIIHERNLVHCDIKASNFIKTESNIYLIDYGNMCTVDETTIYGSLSYCSFEQISRQKANKTFDIYAIGVILYQLLTGKRPFDGLSIDDIIREKKAGNFPLIETSKWELETELNNIIQKATTSVPPKAYISITELKSDILKLSLN